MANKKLYAKRLTSCVLYAKGARDKSDNPMDGSKMQIATSATFREEKYQHKVKAFPHRVGTIIVCAHNVMYYNERTIHTMQYDEFMCTCVQHD